MNLFGNLLLVSITLAISIYLIGLATLALFKVKGNGFYESVFNKLVVGFSVLGIAYASDTTRGGTILLVLAGVIAAILVQWKRAAGSEPTTATTETSNTWLAAGIVKEAAFVVLINATVYIIRYFVVYDFKSPYLRIPYQDYIFYGRLSEHLVNSGVESSNLAPGFSGSVSPVPYHYIELWVNGLCGSLFDVPSVYCLYLATFSVIIAITLTGIMALLSHLQVQRAWIPVLAFLLLNVTGVVWPFLRGVSFFSNSAPGFVILLLVLPKLGIVYVYLIVAFLFLLRQQYTGFGFAVAAVPLVFISTAPVLGAGIVLFAAMMYLQAKIIFRQAVYMVMPIMAAGILLGLFYLFNAAPQADSAIGPGAPTLATLLQAGQGRILINVLAGAVICYAVFNGIYFLIAAGLFGSNLEQAKSALKRYWPLLLWFGTVAFVALIIRTALNNYAESFQVMSNVLIPVTVITLIVLIGLSFAQAGFVPRLLVAIALAGVVAMNVVVLYRRDYLHLDAESNIYYSPDFLAKVDKFVGVGDKRGAFLLDQSDYDNPYNFNQDSHVAGTYVPCLLDTNRELFLPSLSALDVSPEVIQSRFPLQSANLLRFVKGTTFANFVAEKQRSLRRTPPLDSLKYQFVKKYGIKFLCLSAKAKVPPVMQPLVKTVYIDGYSKEKFCILQ